jgi:hypothetical protein
MSERSFCRVCPNKQYAANPAMSWLVMLDAPGAVSLIRIVRRETPG